MVVIIVGFAGVMLAMTALVGLRRMVLFLMLVHPTLDGFFDRLKELSGEDSGPGAAFNILIICLAIIAIARIPEILLNPLLIAWGGFLAVATAALAHSTAPAEAQGTKMILTLVTYAAAAALPFAVIRTRDDVIPALNILLYSTFVPTLVGFFELATTPAILLGQERFQSTFTHPNIFAFYILGVVSLVLFLISSTLASLTPLKRRLLTYYAFVQLIFLIFTQTRSAWLAMIVLLSGFAVFVNRRWLTLIAIIPVVLLIPGIADRIVDLGSGTVASGYEELNSYAWRKLLWNNALDWMSANPSPILGHGLDSFRMLSPLFAFRGLGAHSEAFLPAHNLFLQAYFELGATGLAAYLLMFVVLIVQLLSRMKYDFPGSLTMILFCFATLLVSYSDNLFGYLAFQWFFWFSMGCVVASARVYNADQRVAAGKRMAILVE